MRLRSTERRNNAKSAHRTPGRFFSRASPHAPARSAVTECLMRPGFFSGWGIRTLSQEERRYNPMSYHNGSVWPHDNAMIALGFARNGLPRPIERVFKGMFDAATYMDIFRLPELFCGFQRRRGRGPTLYPVACAPQAWAAATPFALLQASLGLSFNPEMNEIRLINPRLPSFLDEVISASASSWKFQRRSRHRSSRRRGLPARAATGRTASRDRCSHRVIAVKSGRLRESRRSDREGVDGVMIAFRTSGTWARPLIPSALERDRWSPRPPVMAPPYGIPFFRPIFGAGRALRAK